MDLKDIITVLIFTVTTVSGVCIWLGKRLQTMRDEIRDVRYILVGTRESRTQSVLGRLERIERKVLHST